MIDLAALYFGVFIGVFPLTLMKVIQQTQKIVLQSRTYQNSYLYMIWTESIVNFIFAIVTFLYLVQEIPGSVAFYFGTVTLWAIQTQLLSQIIANRISLIMVNKQKAFWLKIGLFSLIACVNIGVYVIWPAAYHSEASPEAKHLNDIFEKAEKSFFLIVDLTLNLVFIYLVRYRLIAHGLSKYWKLFHFNIGLVCLSTAMDAALLGMLSLPNPYLYVQFAPVVYTVKLHIELSMASLIAKIVKQAVHGGHRIYPDQSGRNYGRNYAKVDEESRMATSDTYGNDVKIQKTSQASSESEIPLRDLQGDVGIIKTVTTTVVAEDKQAYRLSGNE